MIEYKILAPNKGGRSQDQNINYYKKGIWRVYFYDSKFSDEVKEANVNKMDLKFKAKIDYKNIDTTRDYLEKWVIEYLQDKKFKNMENIFNIFKI